MTSTEKLPSNGPPDAISGKAKLENNKKHAQRQKPTGRSPATARFQAVADLNQLPLRELRRRGCWTAPATNWRCRIADSPPVPPASRWSLILSATKQQECKMPHEPHRSAKEVSLVAVPPEAASNPQ